MDWGIELWDQFETVDKHHQHGIDFSRRYAKFIKERCAIELDYASKLKKLVKLYQPKKRDEDRSMFSSNKAFQSQLSELSDVAGQHELIAENMSANVFKVLLGFCNELEIEKKRIYQDGKHHQADLDQQERSLEHTKRKFEKEWKECEKAQSHFEKQDNDVNVTKMDVEKARQAWQAKKDSVESCKTDYASALQLFNKSQDDHYRVKMPKLFKDFKDADEKRILKSRELMVEFAQINMKVQPIIQKCLEGMEKAAAAVDSNLDAQLVVDKLKSGFEIPSDKEFEDFTLPHSKTVDGTENSNKSSTLHGRLPNKKGLGWLFGNKKVVETADYSHLPPEQRRKKLQNLIDDLNRDISKEEEGRKAVIKMQEVYRSNPALGDAESLAAQLSSSTAKIEKLEAELSQLQSWLLNARGSLKKTEKNRMSLRPILATPDQTSSQFSTDPSRSRPTEPDRNLNHEQSFGDDFDEEPEPIGTCVALYDFSATSEGALSMKSGEKFSVIEADTGDGWTRAMRGDVDGYVPTSYIEIEFFT